MKTKNNILYSLLALGMVGGIGSAMAQSSAVTDPVGYHQITVYGNGGAPSRITPISTALVGKSEFAGAADTVDAASITVAGTPLTAGAYDGGLYYLSITDGAGAGAWTNITSNTDNTINLADDITAFASAGASFVVRKHTTISDIFGPGNEFGLNPGSSLGAADVINVIDTSPGGATSSIFFSTSALAAGWRNGAFADQADFIIEPGQGLQVQRKQPGDVVAIFAGHVKVEPTIVTVDGGAINIEQVLAPVGVTLGDSNLHTGDLATGVAEGASLGAADNVLIFGVGANDLTTAFYSSSALAAGWRDGAFADRSGALLKEGTAFLLNRKNPASFLWTIPAPTIAP